MGKSPESKRTKSEVTREALLDAARDIFEAKGYSGTNIKDITDRLNVVRGSFYYYFRDKRHIFIELGTATFQDAIIAVIPLQELSSEPTSDDLRRWVTCYFDYLDRRGAFAMRSIGDGPPDLKFQDAVTDVHVRTVSIVGYEFERLSGLPHADSAGIGMCITSMLERAWVLAKNDSAPVDRARAVDALTKVLSMMVGVKTTDCADVDQGRPVIVRAR